MATSNILMISPAAFGFNAQTAENNFFQKNDNTQPSEIQQLALSEFNAMVEKLRGKGINVIVIKDTLLPHTPDSVFPNNWISFHKNGAVVLYPMFAENRRQERREDIINHLQQIDFQYNSILDLTHYEKENRFLEGTGSMIFDRENHIAYAALSERTDKRLFEKFCEKMNFFPLAFHAFQSADKKRLPIYHTNVMMCVADVYAVVCIDAVDAFQEKTSLLDRLTGTGKKIIEISEKQMNAFAGNMLQVQNDSGKKFLVMSQTAYNSLNCAQITQLSDFNEIITVEIPTIEKYGGGSARCMMAEVFLPKKKN
ncbi:MAG: amidinotransferase [Prevotellaceae bacterium]|jgi:hypothetical protein|nr:amidinotransferase [Prevotellaceae bacterium]